MSSRITPIDSKVTLPVGTPGFEFTPPEADAELIKILASNKPFPARDIRLGQIKIGVKGGQDFALGGQGREVVFRGKGSAFAGLAAYRDAGKLVKDLQLSDPLNLAIAGDNESTYSLFTWGYDVEASAKGAMALSAPFQVKFSIDGKREGLYALIRRFPQDTGAQTILGETVASVTVPSLVSSPDELKPGTWLVVEVDGRLAGTIGAVVGYDFNWVRETKLGQLSGAIGMKVQANLAVALGFVLNGRYLLILSRESLDPTDRKIRLQLFKQKVKGWSFALNAKAEAHLVTPEGLAEDPHALVQAVLGVHAAQLLQYVRAIEEWTSPGADLPAMLAKMGRRKAFELLTELTGVDAESAFELARERVLNLLETWQGLDHQVAGEVLRLVEDKVPLSPVREILDSIIEADERSIQRVLRPIIGEVEFFRTPLGRLIMNMADQDLMPILTGSLGFQRFRDQAKILRKIIDGSLLEDTLGRYLGFVDKHFKISQIKAAVEQANLQVLDDWLKDRLEAFLEGAVDLKKLAELQRTINFLLSKPKSFYEEVRKAANHQWSLGLKSQYQKTTTEEALLDVTFDFDKSDLREVVRAAIAGEFGQVLAKPTPGVTLNQASLTHGVKRESRLSLSLPFYKLDLEHLNQSLGKSQWLQSVEGQLLIWDLSAEDTILRKNKTLSRLAIAAQLPVRLNTDLLVFANPSFKYSYTYRSAKKNMKGAELEYQIRPYLTKYFGRLFTGEGSIRTWIGDLDKVIDQLEYNGTDNFGDTLLSLQIGASPSALAAWLKVPQEERSSVYFKLSKEIQRKLKELIPFYYFQDLGRYGDLIPAQALLVYASTPPANNVKQVNGKWQESLDKLHWYTPHGNPLDLDTITEDFLSSVSPPRLAALLADIQPLLAGNPKMAGSARYYKPNDAAKICGEVLRDGEWQLNALFRTEAAIVHAVVGAARTLAKFLAKSQSHEALRSLEEFGAKVSSAFNAEFRSLYGGDAFRPLGSLLFLEAAKVFDPFAVDASPVAIFELIVLRQSHEFPMENFLAGDVPEQGEVLVEQCLFDSAR